jgi:DNA-directed RNA polymerase subunit M/transcription elongation factor TFIIS
MFTIPLEHDIDVLKILSAEQKNELCDAITKYVECYISENRLPEKIKKNIQLDKYNDIIFNLSNSETLVQKIITNELNISSLPWLEPYKLNDKLWVTYIDKRNKNRDIREQMATVNIFKCYKCGEMKCTSYRLQTASIDEPMTTFISCKVCGNSWKVH